MSPSCYKASPLESIPFPVIAALKLIPSTYKLLYKYLIWFTYN